MSEPLLVLEGVSKSFGLFRAVTEMSLCVERGAIHALIGPNGAGKSTLINMIAGGLVPNAGAIRFQGRPIAGLPPHRIVEAGIARSFQITSIFPKLSVIENVRIALMARQGRCRSILAPAEGMLEQEARALLAQVQLGRDPDMLAGELAAGDRKRLEFAMALAGEPTLMLLDEPTAGMSPEERAIVVAIIRDINLTRGVTVLFTEHDIDMVFNTAQRITVMHQGSKLTEGAPAEVRADRRVRDLYLGEAAHARG
jgi:branched-chain amino acid transport system ATP-binding protein